MVITVEEKWPRGEGVKGGHKIKNRREEEGEKEESEENAKERGRRDISEAFWVYFHVMFRTMPSHWDWCSSHFRNGKTETQRDKTIWQRPNIHWAWMASLRLQMVISITTNENKFKGFNRLGDLNWPLLQVQKKEARKRKLREDHQVSTSQDYTGPVSQEVCPDFSSLQT